MVGDSSEDRFLFEPPLTSELHSGELARSAELVDGGERQGEDLSSLLGSQNAAHAAFFLVVTRVVAASGPISHRTRSTISVLGS
jgi:hypothetical protein